MGPFLHAQPGKAAEGVWQPPPTPIPKSENMSIAILGSSGEEGWVTILQPVLCWNGGLMPVAVEQVATPTD